MGWLRGVGMNDNPLSSSEKSTSLSSKDERFIVKCGRLSKAAELIEKESIKNEHKSCA